MRIVRADTPDFTALWQRLFLESAFQHPLYQPWNIRYYEALAQESQFEDYSFVVEEQSLPLLGVRMAVNKSSEGFQELSGFGLPLLYTENEDMNAAQPRGAHRVLKAELDRVVHTHAVDSIIYQDFLNDGSLSFLGKHLLDNEARAVPFFTQIIDLLAPESELYRQIRKSYKSLINWGNKNLFLRVIDGETIAGEDIERFRQLHFHAAGRETRPRYTWDVQYEMVRHREAFVILGELGGELVTAALFPYSARYCFYGVSASKRELFSKPLSHVVVWSAMLYAKERGCVFFELPQQCYPKQGDPLPSEKELSISTFKHGFGGETHVRLRIVWERKRDSV